MQPVFMIGMQRSGSNLLRLMINQLTEIASPHPPHILQRFHPLLDHYGDLSNDNNFYRLAHDVCRLVELNPVPWDGVTFDRDEVISRCGERSLVALHGVLYDLCAQAWGADTWCCKSLANIDYIEEIEGYFHNPKYIFLYRDGRDVALSFRKAVVGEKHFYHIAKDWAKIQEAALGLRDRIDPERLIGVSYETLTSDPEATGRRLCDFLGVEYTPVMLDFHHSEEARRAASSSALWNNLIQPVIQDNTGKFLRESSERDIRIFESVAGNILDRLGYERVHVKKGKEMTFSDLDIYEFTRENEDLKQKILKGADKYDLERRRRQELLLVEIVSRAFELKVK
jgi:LPS sulfotransferase NodH